MHPSLKDYFYKRFSGDAQIDPVKEAELLITLITTYTAKVVGNNIEDGKTSQDIAKLIGETRLAIKDLEDMRRRREDTDRKNGNDGRVVDPIRESILGRIEDYVGERSEVTTGRGS